MPAPTYFRALTLADALALSEGIARHVADARREGRAGATVTLVIDGDGRPSAAASLNPVEAA